MLLLQPKDGISAQSRDVAEDESGQPYRKCFDCDDGTLEF
jgi:hypothetical protein